MEAEAEVPVVLARGLRLRRLHARGPPRLVVRPVRPEVQLAHWDRLREREEGALEVGGLHTPHVLQRAARRLRRALRHLPPDGLGVAPPGHGHRGRLPGPDRAGGQGVDRRDVRH